MTAPHPTLALVVQPSRLWAFLLLVIAITLIAAYAINTPATGQFGLKSGLLGLFSLMVVVGLLHMALRQPRGVLRCAGTSQAGSPADPLSWSWQTAGEAIEEPVALYLALDMQRHLLLRLAPQQPLQAVLKPHFGSWRGLLAWPGMLWPLPASTRWLWLSASQPALIHHWPALRRAVYWRAKPYRPATAPGQGQPSS